MVIWRRDERGAFDTHCLYFFEVAKAEDEWHISAAIRPYMRGCQRRNVGRGRVSA